MGCGVRDSECSLNVCWWVGLWIVFELVFWAEERSANSSMDPRPTCTRVKRNILRKPWFGVLVLKPILAFALARIALFWIASCGNSSSARMVVTGIVQLVPDDLVEVRMA